MIEPFRYTLFMFIRTAKTKNPKTGKVYVSHQLVETVQTEKGPRNRVLLYLGRLDLPKDVLKVLAQALEDRLNHRTSLFPLAPEIEAIVTDALAKNQPEARKGGRSRKSGPRPTGAPVVSCDSLETGKVRSLGPEMVAHQAWQRLDVDSVLLAAGFSPKERALAEAVVVGRLIAPGSELSTHRWLSARSALPEILGHGLETVGKDAVYVVADRLWAVKDRLETALAKVTRDHFPSDSLVFLYDLTNTYLEGMAQGNELARRGQSKEKRSDCPLVSLSLIVDDRGFPFQSHVDAGNVSEPETLPAVLDRIGTRLSELGKSALFPLSRPTIILDRGIATKANLALLRKRGFPYCVIERRSAEKDFPDLFKTARETFEWFAPDPGRPESGVYLHKLPPQDGTVSLLVLSESRRAKEEAIDRRREERFLEELAALRRRLETAKRSVSFEVLARRVGRIEERYPSIARHYAVTLHSRPAPEASGKSRAPKPGKTSALLADRIAWEKKPSREVRTETTGAYVIETTHTDLPASGIWSLYTTLTRVEAAFRSLKTDLGLRPVFHHTADRTRAHLFVSVLAYHLLADIECRLREANDTRSWSTIRSLLETHVRLTVSGTDPHTGRIHETRLSSKPEKEQKALYDRLTVKDPTRRKITTLPPEASLENPVA